jgi:hypothetical protein
VFSPGGCTDDISDIMMMVKISVMMIVLMLLGQFPKQIHLYMPTVGQGGGNPWGARGRWG